MEIFAAILFWFRVILIPTSVTAPLVVIHRSDIPTERIWAPGIILIGAGSYIALLLLASFPSQRPTISMHFIFFGISCLYSTIVTSIIYLIKRKSEKLEIERQQEIKVTLTKFKKHGGAKRKPGPYVPSNAWDVNARAGVGFGTAHSSSEKHGAGMHRMPLP